MRAFPHDRDAGLAQRFFHRACRAQATRLAGPVLILLIILIPAVTGCLGSLSSRTADSRGVDCVKPSMREVLLRWGEWNDTTKVLAGYEVDAAGRLFRTQAAEFSERYLRDSIGTMPVASFCMFTDTTRATFLKIQSLTVRAPVMRYVEYQNPPARVTLRAVWDKRFQTFGSREFRAIFDSLSTFIPHHAP
ncbi:MAG: hypothetical protein ACKO9V_08975 [Candidatus Kapaibacterium sp.]